ncbi:transmembrane protein, putative (macronuclear) [Tetrahymena thermophila SB210]|uniref:Transmembrane protein, putative n=1 Tax=Tetrahymena thermophila (strain SB210) TaxID=312017 RepID=W7X1E9_TETTS|nr:transmembrane protein, putative [Tetrahymena thermophila SB210]EWS73065.1 transmembrane protein, putative [Tetrahymena thermophila SB210]|eukprot:XP_012654403.1 transmembrane protein, putative [Tetrahymena thermophila SB210]
MDQVNFLTTNIQKINSLCLFYKSQNCIGDIGTQSIAVSLSNCNLITSLTLGLQQISFSNFIQIFQRQLYFILQFFKLKIKSFFIFYNKSENKISDEGAKSIGLALINQKNLTSLQLYIEQIFNYKLITKSFKLPLHILIQIIFIINLFIFFQSFNEIGNQGLISIATCLSSCILITRLSISLLKKLLLILQQLINQLKNIFLKKKKRKLFLRKIKWIKFKIAKCQVMIKMNYLS